MPKTKPVLQKDLLQPYQSKLKWLIFFVSLLIYANTINHQFALDDYSIIVNHSYVQNGISGIDEILSTNYRHGQLGFNDGLYRPLSLVTFAIEKQFFNSNTIISHGISCLIYALSCLILFISLQKIFSNYKLVIPLSIVLIFVVHPLHTEVVANIKGRDELLAFLGFSLTLYLLIQYLSNSSIIKLLLAIFTFIVALFSKESAITYVVLIPLLLLIYQTFSLKKIGLITLSLLPFAIGFIFLRNYIIESMIHPVDPGNFGILNNPIAAANDNSLKWGSTFALQLLFIRKLLFPFLLLHDYSFNRIPLVKFNTVQSIFGLFLLTASIALSVWGIVKRNVFGLSVALYLGTIIVASQILLPIGVLFAERMLFLAVLPISILLVVGLNFLLKRSDAFVSIRNQKLLLISLILLGVIYGFKTIDRNAAWKNNLSLYEADSINGKNSARVNYNLGSELNEVAQKTTDQIQQNNFLQRSIFHLNKAIEIYPDYIDAYNNLGLAYKSSGKNKMAIQTFTKGIEKDPTYSKAYFNMATAYYAEKQFRNVIIALKRYIDLKPNSAQAFFLMGKAAGNLQQFEEATLYLNQAISIQENLVDAHNFLGMAYGMTNKNQLAEKSFIKALTFTPSNTSILMNLALSYKNQGKESAANQTLQKILQIDPNHQGAKGMLNQ